MDDGPATWEEAQLLLDSMLQGMPEGSIILATPHMGLSTGRRVQASQERRMEEFLSFANGEPRKDGTRVLAGREVMLDGGRTSAHRLDSLSLPGTSWILVELPPRIGWTTAKRRLRSVVRLGFRPLLAHPERYSWCWSRPERLLGLSEEGVGIQVSARSLRSKGPVGVSVRLLLETGLAHIMASDAHAAGDPVLSPEFGRDVEELLPGSYRELTVVMPGRVLDNFELPPLPLRPGTGENRT